MIKEVELIISGEVQGVGYRQYVARIGRRLKLIGHVKNLEDDTVQIHCKGEEKAITEFKDKINKKNPDDAPLIDVEEITEKILEQGTIEEKIFKEIYDEPNAEMSQGFSTWMKYMALFNKETQTNLNLFRTETNVNFKSMDEKYNLISKGMFAIINRLEESNRIFENRIEKTEKNIESMLKVLIEKKQ